MWAAAAIPGNRSGQAGQMEAITGGKAERRGVGRGQQGRRELGRSRALACLTARDEKPSSGLDFSSGSIERPGFVFPPFTVNHRDPDIFLSPSLKGLVKTSSS